MDPEERRNIYESVKDFINFLDLHYKGIVVFDDAGRVLAVNSRFYEIFGLDPDAQQDYTLGHVLRKYEIEEKSEFFYDKDGHQVNVRFCRLHISPQLCMKAWIFEVVGLENARKKILENIVQYSRDGIHAVDQNGTLIVYNAAQGKIDHCEPRDVIGRPALDVYALNEDTSLLMKVLKTKEPIENVRQNYYTKNGTFVDCVTSVIPLFYHGRIFGSAAIVRDYSGVLHLLEGDGSTGQSKKVFTDLKTKGTRYTFNDIISVNSEMGACVRTAKRAAMNDASILLIGATGTGKEMFAQSIHDYSMRKEAPFLAINCAAIPETLLESLLFGTTKGSFTGAQDKAGLFEEADGGTVFLDEINSMSVLLQAKLLRVLEERAVTRIGSNTPIHVDFRIISSCNESPVDAIRENRMREDLFYRIAVHYVVIPSLKKRREDIPILVEYFTRHFNEALHRTLKGLDSQTRQLFLSYEWPGNVRQLRHVLEAAVSVTSDNDEYISLHHLPKYLFNMEESLDMAESHSVQSQKERMDESGLLDKIRETEREQVVQALKRNNGNVAKAARSLGMSRQKLYYRIKIYGL